MVFQPVFCSADHLKQDGTFWVRRQLCSCLLGFDPADGSSRVRIDRHGKLLVLLQVGKSMNDGQKFSNIVCTSGKGSLMKKLPASSCMYASIFHNTRVSGTGCIYADAVCEYGGCRLAIWLFCGGRRKGNIIRKLTVKRFLCLFQRIKAFVFRTGKCRDLGLTIIPVQVDAGDFPHPYHIIFLFLCQRFLIKGQK